jgi:hypothetical protein
MKFILLTILIFISGASAAGTIKHVGLIGDWKFYVPERSVRYKLAAWIAGASTHKMRLTIKDNKEIILSREFESGKTETLKADRIESVDDLFIAYFPLDHGVMYKLSLTGWDLSHSKRLLGYFYLYNKEGLFNGWPVSFEPSK